MVRISLWNETFISSKYLLNNLVKGVVVGLNFCAYLKWEEEENEFIMGESKNS